MLKKNIAVIGAGWFGCHIALKLKKKNYKVVIYEKEKDIFLGASGANQNRLHLGFHYPRSFVTREQSKKGYKLFIKTYPDLSKKVNKNIYAIAKDKKNIIDFKSYLEIIKSSKLFFKKTDPKKIGLKNIEGAIVCKERLIDLDAAKKFFKKKLNNKIIFKTEIKKIQKNGNYYIIKKKKYDYVINCSWQQFKPNPEWELSYEPCLTFLYKPKYKNLPSLTIMDGPFYTLYEWKKGLFNLYSVLDSRIVTTKNLIYAKKILNNLNIANQKMIKTKVENKFNNFYPNFRKNFKFSGYLKSLRTIENTQTHNRELKIKCKNNFIDVLSGKIDHIHLAEKKIFKCLKKKY